MAIPSPARDMGDPFMLIESAIPEQVATGFQFTEGPLWHPDGYLLFSDIPANRIYRWHPQTGISVFLDPSHNSNGLTLDASGCLLICEHQRHRISRYCWQNDKAAISNLVSEYEGTRLNSPNDLVLSSLGIIYFTDPPYGAGPDQKLDFQGVFALFPHKRLSLQFKGMDRPNGLALSPDEKILYVADTTGMKVLAFPVQSEGTLGEPTEFASLDAPGADGMKVDSEGNIFVTGPDGIWMWNRDGKWIGLYSLPEKPANCAFGDADGKTLYITARTSVYRIRTRVEGIWPH